MILTLFGISIIGGFLSGLLGVGGAVVMIPLMMAVPRLVGLEPLTMNQVAAISMLQVLAASITGCITHRRSGHVHMPTLLAVGIPMGLCALIGALLSRRMDQLTMLVIFACLVVIALVMLLVKKTPDGKEEEESNPPFRAPLAIAVGSFVGTLSGIVGAGGGFLLIPLLITVLKFPVRTTVGSSLGIVFLGALMGSIGKILSMQIEWAYLAPALLGSIPAARVGALVSKRLSPQWIKRLLLVVVFLSLIRTCFDIADVVKDKQTAKLEQSEVQAGDPGEENSESVHEDH